MTEREITPIRTLVGVKMGKGLMGRIQNLDNPDNAVNFMVRNRDDVQGKLEEATKKLRNQRVYLRTLRGGRFGRLESPEKNLREGQEWRNLRDQYITAEMELAFLKGSGNIQDLEKEIKQRYPRYINHPELG